MRKIFDFNVHLPHIQHEDVNVVIENDFSLDETGLATGLDSHREALAKLDGANFLLFNTDLFSGTIESFRGKAEGQIPRTSYTALIDFRRQDIRDYLDRLAVQGAKSIMVNSYLQRIADSDFDQVLKVCAYAASKGLIICIDGSYGTSKMFVYDNMKLACNIADHVSSTPIVIIHSGGFRVIQAMLLALDKTNVWLDTSFSLPYYIGSSLEQDFAFAYKNLGCKRVVYGSDIPYLNSDKSIQIHLDFFRKYNFSEEEIDRIMYTNALELLNL